MSKPKHTPPTELAVSHTPGEWISKEGQIYPEETGKTLAIIPYFDEENEEQKANADLIARAPDYHSILKRLAESTSKTEIYDIQAEAQQLIEQ